MAVQTERGKVHASGSVDRATHDVKAEAIEQANAIADSDGPGDYFAGQLAEAKRLNERKYSDEPEGRLAKFGQNVDLVGLAIALVVVGVVFYVGLKVMSTTEESAGLDTSKNPENRTAFENSSADLTNGIADAYAMSGILFIVLILTGVVGLLIGLRGRR